MLRVKVKKHNRKFVVPVPYVFLNFISKFITSKKLVRFVNNAIEKDGQKFRIPQMNRKELKPLFKDLSKQKGLVIVETRLKDGTEVTVTL